MDIKLADVLNDFKNPVDKKLRPDLKTTKDFEIYDVKAFLETEDIEQLGWYTNTIEGKNFKIMYCVGFKFLNGNINEIQFFKPYEHASWQIFTLDDHGCDHGLNVYNNKLGSPDDKINVETIVDDYLKAGNELGEINVDIKKFTGKGLEELHQDEPTYFTYYEIKNQAENSL